MDYCLFYSSPNALLSLTLNQRTVPRAIEGGGGRAAQGMVRAQGRGGRIHGGEDRAQGRGSRGQGRGIGRGVPGVGRYWNTGESLRGTMFRCMSS